MIKNSTDSTRLAVTRVGRSVAQSVLHPRTADQLIEYSARRVEDLLTFAQSAEGEKVARYALLHAVYSSYEYTVNSDSARRLPYQLDELVRNSLANESEDLLIERPWRYNPASANAAMVALRWSEGQERSRLSREFPRIGSGVSQNMFREAADFLFAWSDCLIVSASSSLHDEDRPRALRKSEERLRALRHLVPVIRGQAQLLIVGLPGEVAWIAALRDPASSRQLLPRSAILALFNHGLTEPVDLLRHDKYAEIVKTLRTAGVSAADSATKGIRNAVGRYRKENRESLWKAAIRRARGELKAILEQTITARQTAFEDRFESILNVVGIAWRRLDDGTIPGAADFLLGKNDTDQVVVELKTSQQENLVDLNGATDVIRGAAIVSLENLPKVTLANPGFDPNVPWQARNVNDLALVEASQFAYGVTLLASGEVNEDAFLDWLTHPGMLSVSQLRPLATIK